MARPTSLSPDVQERICEALRIGATYELAAQYGGVTYTTFNNWMRRGERASKGEFLEFFEAVKRAEAGGAIKWLALIDKAAMNDEWQAAAWKLERRYPKSYGRQLREIVGPDDGPLQVTIQDWRKQRDANRQQATETVALFDDEEMDASN